MPGPGRSFHRSGAGDTEGGGRQRCSFWGKRFRGEELEVGDVEGCSFVTL